MWLRPKGSLFQFLISNQSYIRSSWFGTYCHTTLAKVWKRKGCYEGWPVVKQKSWQRYSNELSRHQWSNRVEMSCNCSKIINLFKNHSHCLKTIPVESKLSCFIWWLWKGEKACRITNISTEVCWQMFLISLPILQ